MSEPRRPVYDERDRKYLLALEAEIEQAEALLWEYRSAEVQRALGKFWLAGLAEREEKLEKLLEQRGNALLPPDNEGRR